VGHASNTVAPTPEEYGSALDDGFSSVMMVGGASISSYIPDAGIQERQQSSDLGSQQIWKLRYSSNGSILYAAGDGGHYYLSFYLFALVSNEITLNICYNRCYSSISKIS